MLKHVDMSSAMRRLAERKIEEAVQNGKFDHLEGAGKPIDLEPMPADENARMLWWAIRLLRKNDVVPDEFKFRKAIDAVLGRIREAKTPTELHVLVPQANELIRRLNTLGTSLASAAYTPLDLQAELARLPAQDEST
jgi:hypothetical protein